MRPHNWSRTQLISAFCRLGASRLEQIQSDVWRGASSKRAKSRLILNASDELLVLPKKHQAQVVEGTFLFNSGSGVVRRRLPAAD